MNRALVLTVAAMLTAGCSGGTTAPQAVDTGKDACAVCRMIVSDVRFAAQVVAPDELPLFFDDLGCLADRLRERPLAAGAVAYVSDHRTRAWVPAASAVYTRTTAVQTPMGSGIIAHANAASRNADPAAGGGAPLTFAEFVAPPAEAGT